jgi:aquaporin Z
MSLGRKLGAEFFGTFWLTFGGCGSAVLAAAVFIKEGASPINIGIGLVGVSLAFGLTVVSMAYAVGHVSGGHFNPAVSVGLLVGGRFRAAELVPYVIAQVLGATAGAFVLYAIASGKDGFGITPTAGAFATNGFGEFSPGGYSLVAALAAEVVLTFFFLLVILGATDRRAPGGFAPLAIGLALTLIHLIGIPVTNLSVNPARSTGPAVVAVTAGFQAPLLQLWLFWAAPVAGAALAGVVYPMVAGRADEV